MAGLFDRCTLCGQPTRRPGELLCIRHDFMALVELGYQRMIERVKHTTRHATAKQADGKLAKVNHGNM